MSPPSVTVETVTANNDNRLLPQTEDTQRTYIARLILRIQTCLQQLGVNITEDVLQKTETMSIFIHESMSISSRNYHSVQHVFDVSHNLTDPIAVLGALFHDCVYYHVDGGLSQKQSRKLQGAVPQMDGTYQANHTTSDTLLCMVERIFGFTKNQTVTLQTGLNEFLSAVICVRELKSLLELPVLCQIAACIEATIPFRAQVPQTPMHRLYNNLCQVNTTFELNLTDQQLIQAVQRAALLGNADVENFGSNDRLHFLDNTWSLLPESNEALRRQFLYTVQEFQFAVFKMNGFFHFVQADVIFQEFQGVPSRDELGLMKENARRNIEIGRKYMGAKLLSASILAAFAELTGGDAPVSLFMGDLPSRHRVSRRLEDDLPPPPQDNLDHCDTDVYTLLAEGRRCETSFDIRKSPLAAYFYGYLGDAGLEAIFQDMAVHPMTRETAKSLLTRLPREAVQQVAINMAKVALSRAELIHEVVDSL